MQLDLLRASNDLVDKLLDPKHQKHALGDGVRYLQGLRQADRDAWHWIEHVLEDLNPGRTVQP
jgi:hypothetical protein